MLTQELVHISIAVVSVWIIALASGQTCRAKFTLQQACSISYGIVIRQLNTLSPASCGLECNQDAECRSFVYTPGTRVCKTNSRTVSSLSNTCSDVMISYGEVVRSTCLGTWIDYACTVNSDCTTLNSQCYNNACRCLPGYSHKRVPDSCHGGCATLNSQCFSTSCRYSVHDHCHRNTYCPAPGYGSTWTEEGYFLEMNNRQRVTMIPSLAACQSLCLEVTSYTCRFLEYVISTAVCHLSNETAYSKPGDAVIESNPDWVQYIRDCY